MARRERLAGTEPTRAAAGARPPVLVLGSGVTALGVLRCLGRASIPAFLLGGARDFVAASRWHAALPADVRETSDPRQLAAFLAARPERFVLLPCTDDWARAVAGLPAEVAARHPRAAAPAGSLERAVDKWRFAEALDELAVPGPRTLRADSPAVLSGLADDELAGFFVKPRDSQAFFRRHRVKALPLHDRAQAEELLRRLADEGHEVMLQEFVPGPATNHYFVDGFVSRDGRVVARFARRRLRMHPPRFGNSSAHVSVPESDVAPALDALDRLLAGLGHRGIFSVELKRDARDGVFRVLELNARPWWYVEFAARCRVDVCRLAYADALGEEVRPVSGYAVGRRCVFPTADLAAWLESRDRVRIGEVLRSWVGAYQPVLVADDPKPGLVQIAQAARRRLGR